MISYRRAGLFAVVALAITLLHGWLVLDAGADVHEIIPASSAAAAASKPASPDMAGAPHAMEVVVRLSAMTVPSDGPPARPKMADISHTRPVRAVAVAATAGPQNPPLPANAPASAPEIPAEPAPAPSEAAVEAPEVTTLASAGGAITAMEAITPAAAAAAVVPVYATRMPPSARLGYMLRKGWLSGRGELLWTLFSPERYEAKLAGTVGGWTVLDWTSRGSIDQAGVAPDRFVVRRRGREQMAANFQRIAGKITYSGPKTEFPLLPGAQDRLTVLLQLSAIAEADPARAAQSGRKIQIFVTGARGDADVWTFDTLGFDSVATPVGTARAIHLRRQLREPRDTRVEIWLDPGRHHLPVRATLANPGDDDPLELQLSEVASNP